MRTHSRSNRNARTVVTGSIPITDEVSTWEVELITAALTTNDQPIESTESAPDKGECDATACP